MLPINEQIIKVLIKGFPECIACRTIFIILIILKEVYSVVVDMRHSRY